MLEEVEPVELAELELTGALEELPAELTELLGSELSVVETLETLSVDDTLELCTELTEELVELCGEDALSLLISTAMTVL